jgi:hypothetical protein
MILSDPRARVMPPLLGWAAIRCASLRPHLLLPAWACAATGAAELGCRVGLGTAAGATGGTAIIFGSLATTPPWGELALAVVGWNAALVAIHLLNLATDRDTDAYNRKNLFWRGTLDSDQLVRAALVAGGLAVLAALAAELLGSWRQQMLAGLSVTGTVRGAEPVNVTSTSWPALVAKSLLSPVVGGVLLTLVLGAVYCLRPLRLSARWGWDLAANAVGYGLIAPCFGATVLLGRLPPPASMLPPSAWLLPLVGAAFLWTTLLDRPGDQATGKRTWAVQWGPTSTLTSALALAAIAWLVVLANLNPVAQFWRQDAEVAGGSALSPADGLRLAAVSVVLVLGILLRNRAVTTRWLPRATMAAVLAAATPALVQWPSLIPLWGGWLLTAYGCLRLATATAANEASPLTSGPTHGPSAPSTAPTGPARCDPPDRPA